MGLDDSVSDRISTGSGGSMGIDRDINPEKKPPYAESYLSRALLSTPVSAQASYVEDDATYHSSNSYQLPYDPIIPLNSDLTIPYSNVGREAPDTLHELDSERRSVFGAREKQKYCLYKHHSSYGNGSDFPKQQSLSLNSSHSSSLHPPSLPQSMFPSENFDCGLSDGTPPQSPNAYQIRPRDLLSPPPVSPAKKRTKMHETLHAQSLILGLAFLAIWSPQNCMAPNLTQMAADFNFSDTERDVYLGANVALATGVLSLPISAGIGILADIYNRKYLFCLTVALGGCSSWMTASSPTYRMLFFARLLNGAFMSGSVPVAFSLLGDLFDTHERNAASSGLTAMMGLGMIAGQVYAGVVGSSKGWEHAFYVSAVLTLVSAALVLLLVREPVRGGKEAVLQAMLKHGTSYDRKLTWSGFCKTMRDSQSNMLLIWQGFFSSIPWGIIFVFLNDYLSQERGFSVPDATYLVAVFGIGCAAGGILGGYWGQMISDWNRSYLPLFMAVTTFLGIVPFVALLNGHFTNAHGLLSVGYSFLGGFIASLPSVCVRPCLLNVNPPESRGAALTAANLIIQLARGIGPSTITLMSTILHVDRHFSFNFTLTVFWTISAIQLFYLSYSLPKDEDAMNAELASYAATALANQKVLYDRKQPPQLPEMEMMEQDVSIEDRMTSWDAGAARESMQFVGAALKEIGDEIKTIRPLSIRCADLYADAGSDDDETDETPTSAEGPRYDLERRRQAWRRQQERTQHNDVVDGPYEHSPLV